MNEINRKKRIKTYWNTVLKQIDFSVLETIRILINIPQKGFTGEKDKEYLKWVSKSINEIKPILKKHKDFKKLDLEMKKTNYGKFLYYMEFYKHKHSLLKNGFGIALKELLFFGEAFDETLNKINPYNVGNYACTIISQGEAKILDRGIYIKIGSETTGDQLKDFINDKNRNIKVLQKELYGKGGVVPESQLFDRNEKIWLVGQISKGMLKCLLRNENNQYEKIITNEKDILACRYLKEKYNIRINEGAYKKTLRNENKIRKNRDTIDMRYLISVNYF